MFWLLVQNGIQLALWVNLSYILFINRLFILNKIFSIYIVLKKIHSKYRSFDKQTLIRVSSIIHDACERHYSIKNWKDLNKVIQEILEEDRNERLLIEYKYKNRLYKFIFTKDCTVNTFPIYTDDVLENLKVKNSILSAEITHNLGTKDYTDILNEYAGPKGNFYEDIGYMMKIKNILDQSGMYILQPKDVLSIISFLGSEYTYHDIDVYLKIKGGD